MTFCADVSPSGEIAIPEALRWELGINDGDVMVLESGDGCILVKRIGPNADKTEQQIE